MSLKNVRPIIFAIIVALSLGIGATSANAAAPRPAMPDGITWQ